MTFAELKTELAARGFSDLSDARLGIIINQARRKLDRMYLWPWRESFITGEAPLLIGDLGIIEAVTNETRQETLDPAQYRWLTKVEGANLDESGVPSYYYVGWPDGNIVLATYPTSTDTIGVQYWKVTSDLAEDDDVTVTPEEVDDVVLDIANQRAYRDRHNHAEAREMQVEIDDAIDTLLQQYPPGSADGQGHIVEPHRG
jgi:hypothetical protein